MGTEVVATIADAERVAEREAKKVLQRAREAAKTIAAELKHPTGSPLYGNGVGKEFGELVKAAEALDERLARQERAVHTYFHGGDE